MSQALYRKYRSRSLDELVGQEHITSLLSAAIAADMVSHAYLLTGPRGVGKTSVARIIAHAINGLEYDSSTNHLDIIEIDAASNNGVDDVRELRERVHISPSTARYKVYIIDEVHMLSKPAFNALLKTLEEPPSHAVFILATTDIDKVPATIISRVQRFNFRSMSADVIAEHLRTIASGENIDIDDDSLMLIAKRGGGSFRDSIGMLDQVRTMGASGPITVDRVTATLGVASGQQLQNLIEATQTNDVSGIIQSLKDLATNGISASIIAEQLIEHLTEHLAERPTGLALIDRLLKVSSSSLPDSQLLVALASSNSDGATAKHSKSEPDTAAREESTPKPKAKAHKPKTPEAKPVAQPSKAVVKSVPTQTVAPDGDYQHSKLLSAVSDIALLSLMNKSGSQLTGSTVTIFAGSKFTAKQLDSPAKRKALAALLASIGYADVSIEVSADKPPLADSQSAAVAAIMGGGEEVDL